MAASLPMRCSTTLTAALPREQDELSVQRLLGYTQQLFWKFLSADERRREGPALERLLKRGLDAAATQSLKSAWFNALRDVALTSDTVGWLERVWKTTDTVPGLTLAEPDFITLALELAVREVPAWQRDPRGAIGADPESRSQGAVRIRQAGALRRCRDPRRVLRPACAT